VVTFATKRSLFNSSPRLMISENVDDDVENRTRNRQYLEREEDDVGTHSVMERAKRL